MNPMSGVPFYYLSKPGRKFFVRQAETSESYAAIDGATFYYEAGDWLTLTEEGNVALNIGKNIVQWAANAHSFCIAASQEANDFLEKHSPGSSYHAYMSLHTNETVLARYTFSGEDNTPWEVLFEVKDEESEIQRFNSNTFSTYFVADDEEAKEYLEYIVSQHPEILMSTQALQNQGVFASDMKPPASDEWTIEERLPCDCFSHEMSVHASNEESVMEFCYWQRGRGEQPWGMKTRFKMIWDILTTGNPYADMIILDKSNVQKLRDTLDKFLSHF